MSTNAAGYPNPELLVETQWLAERLQRPDIRVVDMGVYEGYLKAHIPGAVHPGPGDRSHYLKDPDDFLHIMPPDQFAELMARLGIGGRTLVVAYDADGGHTAARLWWALDYYGHPNCKVLNGGWTKWVLEKRPVSFAIPSYRKGKFTPRPREALLCSSEGLLEAVGAEDVAIVDVRSDAEWDGANDRGNARAGHVPGAIHFEWKARRHGRPPSAPSAPPMTSSNGSGRPASPPNKAVVTY